MIAISTFLQDIRIIVFKDNKTARQANMDVEMSLCLVNSGYVYKKNILDFFFTLMQYGCFCFELFN